MIDGDFTGPKSGSGASSTLNLVSRSGADAGAK